MVTGEALPAASSYAERARGYTLQHRLRRKGSKGTEAAAPRKLAPSTPIAAPEAGGPTASAVSPAASGRGSLQPAADAGYAVDTPAVTTGREAAKSRGQTVYELALDKSGDREGKANREDRRDPAWVAGRRRRGAWGVLLLCLALAAPMLAFRTDLPELVDPSEARWLLTARDTWERRSSEAGPKGLSFDQLVPYRDGRREVANPPGMVWWHQLAYAARLDRWVAWLPMWSGTHPDTTQSPAAGLRWAAPSAMAHRQLMQARMLSGLFALLTVVGAFWAGHSLGGLTAATLSALVCLSNPAFLYYGRSATPAMAHAALSTLACAAALWAIRPLRPQPAVERQLVGWMLCGLLLGLALLTQGLIALGTVVLPVFALLLLCPGRVGHLLGLLAAVLVAMLLSAPWVIAASEINPEAWRHWFAQLEAPEGLEAAQLWTEAGRRGGVLALAMLPWLPWVLGALMQPLSTSSSGIRLRLFLGSAWMFVVAFVVLTAPATGSLGAMLPVLPVFAVVLGHLFELYSSRAEGGWYVRSWTLLRWVHAAGVLSLSLLIPWFLASQSHFVDAGFLQQPVLTDLSPQRAAAVAAALLLLALLASRAAMRQRPGLMLGFSAVWMLVTTTLVAGALAHGRWAQQPLRTEALRLAEAADARPVFVLQPAKSAPSPHLAFEFASGMPLVTIGHEQLAAALADVGSAFVLTPGSESLTDYAVWKAIASAAPPQAQPRAVAVLKLTHSGYAVWRVTHPQGSQSPDTRP